MSIGEDVSTNKNFTVCEHLKDIKSWTDEEIKTKTHWFDAKTEAHGNVRLIMCQACAENWITTNMNTSFSIEGTVQ